MVVLPYPVPAPVTVSNKKQPRLIAFMEYLVLIGPDDRPALQFIYDGQWERMGLQDLSTLEARITQSAKGGWRDTYLFVHDLVPAGYRLINDAERGAVDAIYRQHVLRRKQ
jgi:hypothetical protein